MGWAFLDSETSVFPVIITDQGFVIFLVVVWEMRWLGISQKTT
jgi:hypothetical protein